MSIQDKMVRALRMLAEKVKAEQSETLHYFAWQELEAAEEALAEHEAQAQAVPDSVQSTIGKLLADAMNVAVANGANSVSMPDEYVELAAWLAAAPQPEEPTT